MIEHHLLDNGNTDEDPNSFLRLFRSENVNVAAKLSPSIFLIGSLEITKSKKVHRREAVLHETKNMIYDYRISPEVWKAVSGGNNLEMVTHFTAVASWYKKQAQICAEGCEGGSP